MPNRPSQDELLYCDRCGISFLWSVEEQRPPAALPGLDAPTPAAGAAEAARGETAGPSTRPAADRPLHCPGCRALLPPPGRERGLVKWYSLRKRYGFLVRRDAGEIFLPGSSIVGKKLLQTGDLVEFGLGENDQGPVAIDVQLVAPAAALDVPLEEAPVRAVRHNPAARTRRV